MKTIQKYLFALLIVAMPMMWVGCSSDDDVDNGGVNPGPGGDDNEQVDPNAPIVIENEGNIVMPMEGGETVMKFSAQGPWEVVPDQSWCRISPRSGEKGKNEIRINVPANNSYDERNSMVILRLKNHSFEKKFTVTQKQKNALTITSNKVEVGARGEEITIKLQSNVEVTYEIEKAAQSWLSAATRAMEEKSFVFRVAQNDAFAKRQGTITFSTPSGLKEVVTVYQEGTKEEVILSQTQFTVDHKAQDITVEVKSNVEHTVVMPTDAKWITKKGSRAFSSSTYVFAIEANTTHEIRSAQIKFEYKAEGKTKSEILTVLQKYEGGMSQNLTIIHTSKKFTIPALFGENIVAKILWGDSVDFEDYKKGATHEYKDNSQHTVVIETEKADGFNMTTIEGLVELNVASF